MTKNGRKNIRAGWVSTPSRRKYQQFNFLTASQVLSTGSESPASWTEMKFVRNIFFFIASCCESGTESWEEIFRVFATPKLRMSSRDKKKLPRNRFLNKNKTSCSENDKLVEKLLWISLTTYSNPLRAPKLVVRTGFEFQLLIRRTSRIVNAPLNK